ncbi:MAG: sensor histidine kinase [Actinomycetota bacterium]
MARVLEAERPPAWHGWLDRVVVARGRNRTVRPLMGVVAGLAVCYGVSAALGGNQVVSATWYIPVILYGAARFRYAGGLFTALAAMLLSGPLNANPTTRDPFTLWASRGVVFVIVGVVTSALFDRIVAGKQRELDLAEQERDLAVRQAAVIATVSHEFRTPLTVITGVARTLEVHEMVTPEAVPLLEGLDNAARRLTDLVNTIGAVLDGAESDTFVRFEAVFLREILTHVLLNLGTRDPKHRVTFDVDPEAEIFVSDRELLSQLLRHIVENAVKFSPPDVVVEARFTRSEGKLRASVLDRGPGINENILASVDPFTQGDSSSTRANQGIGLGLFAAKRIAVALGGSITFLPRPGGGTEVVLEIDAPDP